MALPDAWYRHATWLWALRPLSWVFGLLARLRRRQLERQQGDLPLPVIVVGNITVGGTGKTPTVIALARALTAQGWRPGIVSRGHGAEPPFLPYPVDPGDSSGVAGDEPLLLARRAGVPVVIDPQRPRAVRYLAEQGGCDVIISDDGLQHYAMARDVEIVVLDGKRGLGNGWLLPAGPLREPPQRLDEVDCILVNGEPSDRLQHALRAHRWVAMELRPRVWVNLRDRQELAVSVPLPGSAGRTVQAVAGIGNPDRFFAVLENLGYRINAHRFPDHYEYRAKELRFDEADIVVMTEKDAVKCRPFAGRNWWYLAIEAHLPAELMNMITNRLGAVDHSDRTR